MKNDRTFNCLSDLVRKVKVRGDERGFLIPLQEMAEVSFPIKRVYYIYGSDSEVVRGLHAHKKTLQTAVCVAGSCTMRLDDGESTFAVRMDSPDMLVDLPPLIWHEMSAFTPDCVMLVLADALYDEFDYVRSYDDFLRECAN